MTSNPTTTTSSNPTLTLGVTALQHRIQLQENEIRGLKRKLHEIHRRQLETQKTIRASHDEIRGPSIRRLLRRTYGHTDWPTIRSHHREFLADIRFEMRAYIHPNGLPPLDDEPLTFQEIQLQLRRPTLVVEFAELLRRNGSVRVCLFPHTHQIRCWRSGETMADSDDKDFPKAIRDTINLFANALAELFHPGADLLAVTSSNSCHQTLFWAMFPHRSYKIIDVVDIMRLMAFVFYDVFTIDVPKWLDEAASISTAAATYPPHSLASTTSTILMMLTEERDLVLMVQFIISRRLTASARGEGGGGADVAASLARRGLMFGLREAHIHNPMVLRIAPGRYYSTGISVHDAAMVAAGRSVTMTRALLNKEIEEKRNPNALPHLPDDVWMLIYSEAQRDLQYRHL
jgi:hypothetical protein